MSFLYVNEDGATVGVESNQCVVKYADEMKKTLPIESLEGITIMGRSQVTTQCTIKCFKMGIPISYFSKGGIYFGRLQSTGHVNVARQRQQCKLYDTPFATEFARKILKAKIKNQSVVLRRYEKSRQINLNEIQKMMNICRSKIDSADKISEMIGFEGQAAKYYFKGLSECVEPEFKFSGRNRRPPKDEFNSMISLGYAILLNEIVCKIETKGLNPYYGFMHRDSEKHPTLASDLIEEWRAVIIDSVVMSMLNGHEIQKEDFRIDKDSKGCFIQKSGLSKYIVKLEKRLQNQIRYLQYVDYPVSFRRAILLQVNQLAKAIEEEDASLYEPIQIR